jgi:hypothetical protein
MNSYKIYQHFGAMYYLHFQDHRVIQVSNKQEVNEQLVAYVASSLTLKTEVVCTIEILVNMYQTMWCHITEHSTLHS